MKEQRCMNIQNANANEYLLCTRAISLILLPGHKSVGYGDTYCLLVFVAVRSGRI